MGLLVSDKAVYIGIALVIAVIFIIVMVVMDCIREHRQEKAYQKRVKKIYADRDARVAERYRQRSLTMAKRKFKTICTFDLLDHLEGLDAEMIEVRAMMKDGSFQKIYEIHPVEFFENSDLYLPLFKIGVSGQK